MHPTIEYGIDALLQNPGLYRQQRLALVTNDAAITSQGEKTRLALVRCGFQLIRLFSPEHGITAAGSDGDMQPHRKDALTGLPVTSLYGDQWAPQPEELADIDTVIFDIPDVGCRYYTYLWTMTFVMESCAASKKNFLVLDRPNPIGALLEKAEGPFLDEASCSSFIGRWNIPLKHCCTIGELALYFTATRIKQLQIEVVKAVNYRRRHTALHDFNFIATSPAINHISTALLYPGMGLLEGVNVNEGRGTAAPFLQFGAPWIHPLELKNYLDQQQLPGVKWEPVQYTAPTSPYAGETCKGLILQVTDATNLRAVQTGITLLQALMHLYPQQLTERAYPTHANPAGTDHLDKLLGVANVFKLMQQGKMPGINVVTAWKEMIQPFLLY